MKFQKMRTTIFWNLTNRYLVQGRENIQVEPGIQVLLEKQRLFLTHGHLFGPENLPALNQNDVLVYGHTHLPVAEQRGEIFHFNPGSVSIPKGGNPASYGMLDNDVLSVIALNDQSIIAQVAINP